MQMCVIIVENVPPLKIDGTVRGVDQLDKLNIRARIVVHNFVDDHIAGKSVRSCGEKETIQ
jgi:hypothetical protein